MKNWRAHRFTPLAEMSADPWRPDAPMQGSPRMHASIAEGYQHGVDRGYGVGHENGLREGRETGLQEGREAGHREGMDAGKQEVREAFENLAQPVDAMLSSLENLQADYQSALRKEVVELVAKVARQVIRCELALQPAQLLALVDETLETMPRSPRKKIEVYLNEGDLQRIQEIDHSRAKRWKLIADARLESGECRVKSGDMEADAGCRQRLTACIEQISTQLLPQTEELEAVA